jgi:hypothetical protein
MLGGLSFGPALWRITVIDMAWLSVNSRIVSASFWAFPPAVVLTMRQN